MNGGHKPTQHPLLCCALGPRGPHKPIIAAAVDGAGNAVVADSAHAPASVGCQSPRRLRCPPCQPPRLTAEALLP